MPGCRVLGVAARQLAVLGITREQDRHHRCRWHNSVPGLRAGKLRSIERPWPRSCALVFNRPLKLGARRSRVLSVYYSRRFVSGILAGIIVFAIGTISGQNMRLGDNWKLIALQVTLGLVLEEIVFRGYLFAFLMWLLSKAI